MLHLETDSVGGIRQSQARNTCLGTRSNTYLEEILGFDIQEHLAYHKNFHKTLCIFNRKRDPPLCSRSTRHSDEHLDSIIRNFQTTKNMGERGWSREKNMIEPSLDHRPCLDDFWWLISCTLSSAHPAMQSWRRRERYSNGCCHSSLAYVQTFCCNKNRRTANNLHKKPHNYTAPGKTEGEKTGKKPTKESLTERSDTKFCVFYVYANSSTTGHSLLPSLYVSLTEDDRNHNSRSNRVSILFPKTKET